MLLVIRIFHSKTHRGINNKVVQNVTLEVGSTVQDIIFDGESILFEIFSSLEVRCGQRMLHIFIQFCTTANL